MEDVREKVIASLPSGLLVRLEDVQSQPTKAGTPRRLGLWGTARTREPAKNMIGTAVIFHTGNGRRRFVYAMPSTVESVLAAAVPLELRDIRARVQELVRRVLHLTSQLENAPPPEFALMRVTAERSVEEKRTVVTAAGPIYRIYIGGSHELQNVSGAWVEEDGADLESKIRPWSISRV